MVDWKSKLPHLCKRFGFLKVIADCGNPMTSKMVDWKIHTDLTCVETIQYDAVGGLDFQSTIFEALDNLAQQVYYYAILEC